MYPRKTFVFLIAALSGVSVLAVCAAAAEQAGEPATSKSGSPSADEPTPHGTHVGGYRFRGGRGPGEGSGPGMAAEEAFLKDRELFHQLLDNRKLIRRTVKKIDGGVETLTESDDPKIAAAIQAHVASMRKRVEEIKPIHMRDPLFAAVFIHAKKISIKVEKTDAGVRVVEVSDDPFVASLLQAHADVVSLFVANGRSEVQNNHALPAPPDEPGAQNGRPRISGEKP